MYRLTPVGRFCSLYRKKKRLSANSLEPSVHTVVERAVEQAAQEQK